MADTNEQIAYLRKHLPSSTDKACKVFVDNEEDILNGTFEGPPHQAYGQTHKTSIRELFKTAFKPKSIAQKMLLDIELAGYQVITTLIDLMIEAVPIQIRPIEATHQPYQTI